MTLQQRPHIHSPLWIHHAAALAQNGRLHDPTNLEDVVDILGCGACDLDALAGMDGHQPVLCQRQHGLPHRRPSQLQCFLQLRLIDKLPRHQLLLQDHDFDAVIGDTGQTFLFFSGNAWHRYLPDWCVIYHQSIISNHIIYQTLLILLFLPAFVNPLCHFAQDLLVKFVH